MDSGFISAAVSFFSGCESDGIGLCASGFKGRDAVPQMVKAYLDKKIKVDEFITHNMALDQVNDAIELMKRGKW